MAETKCWLVGWCTHTHTQLVGWLVSVQCTHTHTHTGSAAASSGHGTRQAATSWSFSLVLVLVPPVPTSATSMSLLSCTTLLLCTLLLALPIAISQFDKPKNANKFVDSVSPIPLLLFVKFTTAGFADDCTSGECKQLDDPAGG